MEKLKIDRPSFVFVGKDEYIGILKDDSISNAFETDSMGEYIKAFAIGETFELKLSKNQMFSSREFKDTEIRKWYNYVDVYNEVALTALTQLINDKFTARLKS